MTLNAVHIHTQVVPSDFPASAGGRGGKRWPRMVAALNLGGEEQRQPHFENALPFLGEAACSIPGAK